MFVPVVSTPRRRKRATAEAKEQPEKALEPRIPAELPVLPIGDSVLYPAVIVPLSAENENTIKLIDEAMAGDKTVGVFAQHSEETGLPQRLHRMGTAALITRMFRMPDGSLRALLQGLGRVSIREMTQTEPYLKAKVEPVAEQPPEKGTEIEAKTRNLAALFQKVISLSPHLSEEVSIAVANISDPGRLADFASAHINLSTQEKQQVLETTAVDERTTLVAGFLNRELEILELGSKIQSQVKEEMSKGQREFYLREQLKAIQKELGEGDERAAEVNEFKERMEKAQLPEEARKEAHRELERLSRMNPQAAEYSISRTYLDWITSLPWTRSTPDTLDIDQTARILDEDHYGLEKVKERILDYLAVRKLRHDMRGPILCFVGPPGTGKTSMGQSIARALGRKFVRLSLGGIRDEAEIRGHRRTYIGALPGRVIQSLRRADSNNPVFMLDEIDKVGADFRGDPSAALLEVLDPEQNSAFSDHYLAVPFDLSKVMFITTANLIDPIIPALRDRMEVLELPGYGEAEKLSIAKGFLIPRQLKEHGLSPEQLLLTDEAIGGIIREYTREAGVRGLERQIGTVCRKVARRVAQGTTEATVVTGEHLREYLGHQRVRHEMAGEADEVGVATGLAWTESGGDVLFVEATLMPGKGSLILTGKLGEVMQESARAALSYARSRAAELGIDADFYSRTDVHIHIPAGAIPKDGPSAGITMTVALVSALTRRPVPRAIGMTGEITLRGKVLPVGGIKEKVLAAHRAGIKKVVLPRDNQNDLEEVPQYVREQLQFVLVEKIDEVIGTVLKEKPEMVRATI